MIVFTSCVSGQTRREQGSADPFMTAVNSDRLIILQDGLGYKNEQDPVRSLRVSGWLQGPGDTRARVALSDPAGQYLCPKCAHHQNRWVREASISATAQLEGSKLARAKRQKLEADVTELRSFFKSDKQLVQEHQVAPSSGTCAWLGSCQHQAGAIDGSTFKPILHRLYNAYVLRKHSLPS
jgi:hypothetical protein